MASSDCAFANAVVWDEIWSYILDCVSVYQSRRVCKKWKCWLDVTLRKRYDYDKFLAAYFPEQNVRREFRVIQALHGVVISGSKALDFLGKFGFAVNSDTDIYATYDGVVAVGDFFAEHGYRYLGDRPWRDDIFDVSVDESTVYSSCDVVRVFKFKGPEPTCALIDLVLVADAPMCSILHFHATIVMNGLYWDRAVAAYPEATFKHRRGIALYGSNDRVLDKYRERGFHLDRELTAEGAEFSGCLPTTPRTLDDGLTWTIKFDTEGVEPGAFTAQPAANCFALRSASYPPRSGDSGMITSAFYMTAMSFEHRLLSSRYAMHHACRPFAKRVLNYMAERSTGTTSPGSWRVRLNTYNHALTSWDNIMPFIVRAWIRGVPLFLRKGHKYFEFRP